MATYASARTPQAYRESAILTASPEQLVVMLYDGANRFLLQASTALQSGQVEAWHDRLRRAEAIVDELDATLDLSQGGEVAQNLKGIYVFCRRLLTEARIEKDPGKVDQVRELLGELRGAWAEIAGS